MRKEYKEPDAEFIMLSKNDLFATSSSSECPCYDDYDAVCSAEDFCLDI